IALAVEHLHDHANGLMRPECALEGLNGSVRVFAKRDRTDVEEAYECELRRLYIWTRCDKPRFIRFDVRHGNCVRHDENRYRGLRSDRFRNEARCDPNLVDKVEAIAPFFRKLGRFPCPATDKKRRTQIWWNNVEHTGRLIGIHAKDRYRIGRA